MDSTQFSSDEKNDDLEWPKVLGHTFRLKLTDDEITFWKDEIRLVMQEIKDEEICQAIRWGATQENRDKRRLPGLSDLYRWINSIRRESMAEQKVEQATTHFDPVFVDRVKQRMFRAGNTLDAWNMLCQPTYYCNFERDTTLKECWHLERWAQNSLTWWEGRPNFAWDSGKFED